MPDAVSDKKQIGAYYTPKRAADLLVNWALRGADEFILEPSFGGCGFLDAANRCLESLGAKNPISQLYGFDIDKRAFDELVDLFGEEVVGSRRKDQFILGDFMAASPDDLSHESFDAVVGNPPYVSYHSMGDSQREVAGEYVSESDFELDRKASLWAYFVLHALDFLKPGGRVAWVLPGSFLQTEYGSEVRNVISESFERSVALLLNERLFLTEGTEENSVLLFAEGWKQGTEHDTLTVGYAETLSDLASILDDWKNNRWKGAASNDRIGISLMTPKTRSVIDIIEEKYRVDYLGNIADIKIGIVTGANRFFILDKSGVEQNHLQKSDLHFVLPKFRVATGLRLTKQDFEDAYQSGERCLLVKPSTGDGLNERVEAYFSTFDKNKKESNATFKKRNDWRDPDDPYKPDAFFPYMHQSGPRLVLNEANVNSTNTVHRVYFKPGLFEERDSGLVEKAVSISLLSTYSQLSAELQGRIYGSGVLKHEPSDARRIKIIIPSTESKTEVDAVFNRIDTYLRNGEPAKAEHEANRFVFGEDDISQKVEQLRAALHRARERRSVKRNGN